MSKVKIFVACHKAAEVPNDDVYTPIHVGKSISNLNLGHIGDDTGDNISAKNSTYSEMTAHYWVWKNLKKEDAEYVGFCHYRRFFIQNFTQENIDGFFADGTDVILSSPVYYKYRIQQKLLLYVSADDYAILHAVIKKQCPDYLPTINKYLMGVLDNPYNMLICRKEVFDDYCTWMFSILDECEKNIRLSPYSRARRVMGYIAEFLTPIYFMKNGCKIKMMDTVCYSDAGVLYRHLTIKMRLYAMINSFIVKWRHLSPYMIVHAHRYGLRDDGVEIYRETSINSPSKKN
ncbi:MAG: DUF4422 domain-containing protein [Paludibacteraceae bacterium]|nr:DUF4422 domain-containing protein [Paludibacteraceae bacterium]